MIFKNRFIIATEKIIANIYEPKYKKVKTIIKK